MTKAKRKIHKFDFTNDGAHVAMVDAAANKQTVLVMKGAKEAQLINPFEEINDVVIEKALNQVTVELSFQEFLRKFFDMWWDDAELLTKLLGMQTEHEYWLEQNNGEATHKDYLEERLEGFSIMKALNDKEINEIPVESYLNIVETQETFEKNLRKEDAMTKEVKQDQSEDLQKSLVDMQKQLKEQSDLIKQLTTEREAIIVKALQDEVSKFSFIEKAEDVVELVKGLTPDGQDLLFATFQKAADAIEASVTTQESVEGEAEIEKSDVEESRALLRKSLQSKYVKSQD